MREILIDILNHSMNVAEMKVLKIVGTAKETTVHAANESATLFIEASLKAPVQEFAGKFGITNLKLLKGLLDFPSYNADGATFSVKKREVDGSQAPEVFEFKDARGAGAKFRLMNEKQIPEGATIKSIPWDTTVRLTKSRTAEFQGLASLYTSEVDKFFSAKTEDGNLLFLIGDDTASTHSASVVMAENVTGTLKAGPLWNTTQFLQVMKLCSEAEVRITSRGVLCVAVESNFGTYKYYLRASARG